MVEWFWLLVALGAGAMLPKLLLRQGVKVPEFILPDRADDGPTTAAEPAAALKATSASRRPLLDCYDWFVRASSGLIEPSAGDLRLARAIKPHLDNLVAGGATPGLTLPSLEKPS